MRVSLRLIAVVVTAGLVVPLASCDKSPTSPSPRVPQSPPPPAPAPGATVVGLEIVAPPTIEPGASTQLKANAVKSDGSVEDVTSQTNWMSSDPGVLQISADGVITARARGQATINGRYQSRSAATSMMVLPNGTFRLAGAVTDSGLPIGGVTLEVIRGTGEGLTAVTNGAGGYAFYGVGGNVRVHAQKQGYVNRIEEVHVSAHSSLNFQMTPAAERRNLGGTYTLNVTATCSGSALPAEAQSRSYVAAVEQAGPRLTVRLSGADFIVTKGHGDHFSGTVTADDRVTFDLGGGFYYYYYGYFGQFDLVERFSTAQALVLSGVVTAQSGPTTITGVLNGSFALTHRTAAPFVPFASSCHSPEHRFEMVRR